MYDTYAAIKVIPMFRDSSFTRASEGWEEKVERDKCRKSLEASQEKKILFLASITCVHDGKFHFAYSYCGC